MSGTELFPVSAKVAELLLNKGIDPDIPREFLDKKRYELKYLIRKIPELDNYIMQKFTKLCKERYKKDWRTNGECHLAGIFETIYSDSELILMIANTKGDIDELLTNAKEEINSFLPSQRHIK